jgi:hypothetical protein
MNKKNERKKTDLGAPAAGAAPSHFFLVRIYLDIHSLFFPPSIVLLFFLFLFEFFELLERDHAAALINRLNQLRPPFYPWHSQFSLAPFHSSS